MDPFTPTYISKDLVRNVEKIVGGIERDVITGDDRDNVFVGGPGNDILSGKGGADVFVYKRAYGPGHELQQADNYTGDTDAILDFSRKEGDKIDLSGFAIVGGHELTFAGEAPTFEADTPWGARTYSEGPDPYTINYERGIDFRDNPIYGDSRFEDAEGNPLYKSEDGISLRIDYGGNYPFLVAVWGEDKIHGSDLIL